jgi:hypothetical protein
MPDGLLEPARIPAGAAPLSPSGYQTLKECGLRYAWEERREPSRLPGSPSARLGSVVHDLYMQAGQGEISPDETAVRQAWRASMDVVEARMRQTWLENHFVPLRSHVRHFEETRQGAIRHSLSLAERAAARTKGASSGGLPPEGSLTSSDGKVSGRIDVTIWTPEGVVIRDYKTGNVFEDMDGGGEQIKVAYQFQLKLYAALHAEARNVWPIRLELMTVAGEIVEIHFTENECKELMQKAKQDAEDLWTLVADVNAGRMSIDNLASPGDACTWCRYRPVCPAYRPWAESHGSDEPRRRDAWGEVRSIGATRRGLSVIDLDTTDGPIQILDLDPSPSRNPGLNQLESGSLAAVFDAILVSKGSLRAVDQTVVYRTDQPC